MRASGSEQKTVTTTVVGRVKMVMGAERLARCTVRITASASAIASLFQGKRAINCAGLRSGESSQEIHLIRMMACLKYFHVS
jgi:hypothetical protein